MPSNLRKKKYHCIAAHLPHCPLESQEKVSGAVLYILTEQAAEAQAPNGMGAPQPAPGPALQEFNEAQRSTRSVCL